jgi:hypothetical protein
LFFNRWKSRVKESRRSQSFAACLDFAQSPRAHREHDALSESAKKRKKSAEEEEKKFWREEESLHALQHHKKKKLNVLMSTTTHKYVRAQYERLLIALNDLTKYAETDAEKEQRLIRYAYAVRNFNTSLSELEQELKLVEENALSKTST